MKTSTNKKKTKDRDETSELDDGFTSSDEFESGDVVDSEGVKTKLINLAQDSGSVKNKVDELLVMASETRRGRKGGDAKVAPYVKPKERIKQSRRARGWRKQGFIELSPGRPKLRHRILPRSVIGISFMLLASAVGVAFSGAAFYAYYDHRLAENEREVSRFVDGFDQQFNDATGAIDDLRTETVEDIRTELKPIEGVVSDADGVINLPTTVGESVWSVETRDADGRVALGSAFAVLKHSQGTALVTSFDLVSASATEPSPSLTLTKKGNRITGQLWSWDEERDVAIVMVPHDLPVLALGTPAEQTASIGTRVFAMSGFGGQGATASPGVLLDQSVVGLQHTAPVGTMFRGGPVVNGSGKVVGLATLKYQPTGVDPGLVAASPDSASFCQVVLKCSEVTETITVEVVADSAEAPPAGNEEFDDAEPAETEGDDAEASGDGESADDEPAEEDIPDNGQ